MIPQTSKIRKQILGSSLTFSALGGRGKEKNLKPAEKIAAGARARRKEGYGGGIPPRPSVPPSEARRQSVPFKKGSDFVK